MAPETPRPRFARLGVALCALLPAAFAFFHASRGIAWSRHFHPDELTVAKWIGQSYDRGYVSDRVYPGGWFVLMDARTALAERASDLSRRWRNVRDQDGAVVATDADSFESDPKRAKFHAVDIQAGRDFNVLLFAGAVLFLFLAARETGAGPVPSALAALLFAVQPFPLEHAHYCETDGGLVVSLCAALWLTTGAVRRASPRRFAAACAAAGFAIACKYTAAPLLVWIPVLAPSVAAGRAPGGRPRARAVLRLAGAAALAALGGFLAGTPALWLDPAFFFGDLVRIGSRTYAESGLALGADHSFAAGCLWRARILARELLRLGPAPLLFFAACFPVWFVRGGPRRPAAAPPFLAAFLLYAVFLMPWIRNQELLPVLPCLCLGAAPALSRAGAALRRGPGTRRAAAAALCVLFAAAFARSAADGNRILSCFARRDTRAECQNWLAACARPGVPLVLEPYVVQTIRGTPCTGAECGDAAASWPEAASLRDSRGRVPRYVLRNASFSGRGASTASARENAARFDADCPPLLFWKIAPGGTRTLTFSQPDVELRALPGPEDGPDVAVCLDRPVFFSPGLRPLYGPSEAAAVGPVRAVQTVGARHSVHPPPEGGCWAVSRVLDGPKAGAIRWDGLFSPERAALSAAGVSVARLDDAAFRRAAASDVRPAARVRLRGADDQATVCATFPCSDPAEVARILRRAGDPAAALSFLRGLPELDAAARAEAFLAAAASGAVPEPAWTDAARAAVAAFDEAAASGGTDGIRVRGVPLRVLRDFSVVRLGDWEGLPTRESLPVFLPAGVYGVEVDLKDGCAGPAGSVWFDGQEGAVGFRRPSAGGDAGPPAVRAATVRQTRDGLLRVRPDAVGAEDGTGRRYRSLSVEWDPFEQLERAVLELRRALDARNP